MSKDKSRSFDHAADPDVFQRRIAVYKRITQPDSEQLSLNTSHVRAQQEELANRSVLKPLRLSDVLESVKPGCIRRGDIGCRKPSELPDPLDPHFYPHFRRKI